MRIVNILLLTLVLAAPLASAALLSNVGDSFASLFTKIDRFFSGQQYKPYTKTIDFFFFTLLFVSIYLVVIKYAFKENTRIVKFIAFLLGLMSGFLLVQGGYTTAGLLPYIPWFLFILLAGFIFYFLGRMGMKGWLWRLLLSFFIAAILIFLLGYLMFPSSQKFSTFFDGLGRIDIPSISAPSSSFSPPSFGAGSGYGPGTGSVFPSTGAGGGGSTLSDINFWVIAIVVGLLAVFLLVRFGRPAWTRLRNRGLNELSQIIQNLQREFGQYQFIVPQYINSLRVIIRQYQGTLSGAFPNGNRHDTRVVDAITDSNAVRVPFIDTREANINHLMHQIATHPHFARLPAGEQAALIALVGNIYRYFGNVTAARIAARREFALSAMHVDPERIPMP